MRRSTGQNTLHKCPTKSPFSIQRPSIFVLNIHSNGNVPFRTKQKIIRVEADCGVMYQDNLRTAHFEVIIRGADGN